MHGTAIIPALPKDKAYRKRSREAMDLKAVFEIFKGKEPYSVGFIRTVMKCMCASAVP